MIAALILYVLWIYEIRRPVYQHLYGKPEGSSFGQMVESWTDVPLHNWQSTKVAGYDIDYKIRKKYTVTGRVVYVDWYSNFLGTWYRSAMDKGEYLYDAVVPVDLSVVHGSTADDNNWKKISFSHEERLLISRFLYKDKPVFNRDEINNNHVIPASENVLRALEIVKRGEIAFVEGYLIDWRGKGDFADYKFNTALTSGEISSQKAGGMITGLCRQFYVTKIIFDGYAFE